MDWTPEQRKVFVRIGKLGGTKRAKNLSEKRQSEIGKIANKESVRVRRAKRDARLAQEAQSSQENVAA